MLTLSGGTTIENNSAKGGSGGGGTRGISLAAGSALGSALYVVGSTVNLTGATLSSNTAQGGNGHANEITGTAFRFYQRLPAMAPGNAVYSDGGTVTLSSDNVSSNTAQGGQGGSLKSGLSTAWRPAARPAEAETLAGYALRAARSP